MKSNYSIQFLGAAKRVTGSCYLINANLYCGKNVSFIVDCGLFQENRHNYQKHCDLNTLRITKDMLSNLDFIIISHAHTDHNGLLPYLYKLGFRGDIYSTEGTFNLSKIMLPDSAHICKKEAEYQNIKNKRLGRPPVEPLYSEENAENCLGLFQTIPYDTMKEINPDKYDGAIQLRFKDASHILGSATIETWITDVEGNVIYGIFSGDIGQNFKSEYPRSPEFVVLESTYGNRKIENLNALERDIMLARIIIETYKKGGNTVIPSFAVGRTQSVLLSMNQALRFLPKEESEILQKIPFVVDSPMATDVTKLFENTFETSPEDLLWMDTNISYYIENGINPFSLPNLTFVASPEESQALQDCITPMVLISASGMGDAGRIRYHLKNNIYKESASIVFIGFQAQGTLGRKILDGADKIKIFGDEIPVNARIEFIPEYSAHGSQPVLLNFVKDINPKNTFLVHGEESQMCALKTEFETLGYNKILCPELGDVYSISKYEPLAFVRHDIIAPIPAVNVSKVIELKRPRNTQLINNINSCIELLSKANIYDPALTSLSPSELKIITKRINKLNSAIGKIKHSLCNPQSSVKKGKNSSKKISRKRTISSTKGKGYRISAFK